MFSYAYEPGCKDHLCLQNCNSSVMISVYGYGNETRSSTTLHPNPMSGAAQGADRLCTCTLLPAWVGNWPFLLVVRIRPGGQPHAHALLLVK